MVFLPSLLWVISLIGAWYVAKYLGRKYPEKSFTVPRVGLIYFPLVLAGFLAVGIVMWVVAWIIMVTP